MTPEKLLRAMCERHGLPAEYGARLIPLIRRAMESPDEVKQRILALVDGNLAQCAQGSDGAASLWRDLDHEVLLAVARVLHEWSPSEPLLDLGPNLGGLSGLGSVDTENP